jgi:AcrR family transcriptional regulator
VLTVHRRFTGRDATSAATTGRSRTDEILAAAAALFFQRGFTAVGVDEIGAKVGMSGPGIYRHFKSKDDILGTLFDQGIDEVMLATGGRFDDPRKQLAHMCVEHTRHVVSDPYLASVWIRERRSLVEPHRSSYVRRARRYLDRWQDCVSALYPDARQERVAIAVRSTVGVLNSVPDWPESVQQTPGLPEMMATQIATSLAWLGDARGAA